jgi:hypothetical protein
MRCDRYLDRFLQNTSWFRDGELGLRNPRVEPAANRCSWSTGFPFQTHTRANLAARDTLHMDSDWIFRLVWALNGLSVLSAFPLARRAHEALA